MRQVGVENAPKRRRVARSPMRRARLSSTFSLVIASANGNRRVQREVEPELRRCHAIQSVKRENPTSYENAVRVQAA